MQNSLKRKWLKNGLVFDVPFTSPAATREVKQAQISDFFTVGDVEYLQFCASFGYGIEHDVGGQCMYGESCQIGQMANAFQ